MAVAKNRQHFNTSVAPRTMLSILVNADTIGHERLTENRRYFWPGERIPRVYRWLRLCKDSWSLTQTRPAFSKTKSRSLTGNDHAQVPHSLELG